MMMFFSDAEVDSKQELLIIDDAEISDVEATEESAPVATGLFEDATIYVVACHVICSHVTSLQVTMTTAITWTRTKSTPT